MANDPVGRTPAGQMTPGHEQWQVEGGAAELYQHHLVPTVTAGWAAGLVDRVGLSRGERVLDAACGTGVVARAAAERVGRTGRVAEAGYKRIKIVTETRTVRFALSPTMCAST